MKIKKILLGFLGIFLCLVLFALTVSAGLSVAVGFLLDESTYKKYVISDDYVAQLENIIIDRLESEALFYDIPVEYVNAAVDTDTLYLLSENYITELIAALKTGGELPTSEYSVDKFAVQINRYLNDNPEIAVYFEQETINELSVVFADTVNNVLNNFININAIASAARTVYSNKYINLLADSFYYIVIAALLCGIGIILLNLKNVLWGIYKCFGTIWCGSVLLFVPAKLIENYDLPSKLILEQGPFKVLLDGILYSFTDVCVKYSTVIFASASAALAISIILLIVFQKNSVDKQISESVSENEKN